MDFLAVLSLLVVNLIAFAFVLSLMSLVTGVRLGTLTGMAVVPMFRGIGWTARKLFQAIRATGKWLLAEKKAEKSEATTEKVVSAAQLEATAPIEGADRVQLVNMDKGRASCVLLFKGTTIERILRLHDPNLVRAAGFHRKTLTRIEISGPHAMQLEEATRQSRKDCRTILKAAKVMASEPKDDVPKHAVELPKVTETAPAGSAAPEAQGPAPPKTRSPQLYRGRLMKSGVETRTGVKDPYTSFCIDLDDSSNPGATNRVWGADLARALEESAAKRGDLIEVVNMGKTPVPVRRKVDGEMVEKTEWKKLWKIQRLHS